MKLSCYVWLNWVRSVTKTRQDNDMTDCIGTIYVENETELSWPIKLGVVYDEN